jgi:hypothetical protein
MYYKVVERFGPQDGERWQSYLAWRGLGLDRFDSVDAILRPDLFVPQSAQDWDNCVNADDKLSLITDREYAIQVADRYDNAVLLGVEIELDEGHVPQDGLLGFDIIDEYCNVSLVTNWGTEGGSVIDDSQIMSNGLIRDFGQALQIRDLLRGRFPEDPHAGNCEVWAVYSVDV